MGLAALSWKPPHLATCVTERAFQLTEFLLHYKMPLLPLKSGIVLPPARN